MLTVAIGWHLYPLTGSVLDLDLAVLAVLGAAGAVLERCW
ncbi:hypothetical protein AB7M23_001850 [Pseudomonas sp. HLS-6 TE3448]|jgi:hypothetical protein